MKSKGSLKLTWPAILSAIASLSWLLFSANSPCFAAPLSEPSFSCKSATPLEAVICSEPGLSDRDRKMAALFDAVRVSALGSGPSREQELQRKWLELRNVQCSKGNTKDCLAGMYDDRLEDLAIAALFKMPDLALSELRRLEPKAAPIYEAIYRYATVANKAERVRIVGHLINPAFNAIHDKPGANELSEVPDAYAAASTDQDFSMFLDVASVSDFALRMTLPCSAVIRRPGLIKSLGSVYGGMIDSQLIRSDCEATMPATPAFDRLVSMAEKAQPVCQGTIRFSLSKDYEADIVAIRIHRLELLRKNVTSETATDSDDENDVANTLIDEPHFRSKYQQQIKAATDELAKYYTNYFRVPVYQAKVDAGGAVSAAISGAYDLCE